MPKKIYIFGLVLVLSLATRLIWLGQVPTGIPSDVLDFVIEAKSIFMSGHDTSGKWSPSKLAPIPNAYPKDELASTIISPLIGPLPLNLFTARLPSALSGIAVIALIYLISLKLFGPLIAQAAGLVAVFNPGLFILNRSGFMESMVCAFFLLGFLILLSARGWVILTAFVPFFFGFYSYYGTKLIFLPFVFLVSFYAWKVVNKRRYLGQYLLLALFCIFLVSYFIFSLQNQPANRLGEILTPMSVEVSALTNEERRLSVMHPFIFAFNNKPVLFSRLFLEKYLNTFSTDFLFLHGGGNQYFSLWRQGVFYYLDFPLMILGLIFLLKKKNPWLLLVGLIALAPLPAALSLKGGEYATRAIMIFPFLIILVAAGMIWLKEKVFGQKHGWVLMLGFFSLYLWQIANFGHLYFLRNPIYNSEGMAFSSRVLAHYLNLSRQEKTNVFVLSDNPLGSLKSFLFYTGEFGGHKPSLLLAKSESGDYVFENLVFSNNKESVSYQKGVVILDKDFDFFINNKNRPHLSISQLSDGGERFLIINDVLCSRVVLNSFPSQIRFSDFRVEKVNQNRFCEKFISKVD